MEVEIVPTGASVHKFRCNGNGRGKKDYGRADKPP